MRTYRSDGGPFAEAVYYTPKDVESICADELQNVGLYPTEPGPVRIERFIKKRFNVDPVYDDLPSGVLGYTEFGKSGVLAVYVSRALSEDGRKVSERRLSTTLAHEAGHGLLHAHLFALGVDQVAGLLRDGLDAQKPRILCRDGEVGESRASRRYDGRWWEHQANMTIGALLMPRRLVEVAVGPHLQEEGSFGRKTLPAPRRAQVTRDLAALFEVNPIVAEIRLQQVFPPAGDGQLSL